MNAWLQEAVARLAAEAGVDPASMDPTFDLSAAEAKQILDVARHASHDSGDRTNAPLLCYLLGRAVERGTLTLEDATTLFPAD